MDIEHNNVAGPPCFNCGSPCYGSMAILTDPKRPFCSGSCQHEYSGADSQRDVDYHRAPDDVD